MAEEEGNGGGVPNVPGQQEAEDDLLSWKNVKGKLDSADEWASKQLNAVGDSVASGFDSLAKFDPWAPFKRQEQQIAQKASQGLMDVNDLKKQGDLRLPNRSVTSEALAEQFVYTYEPARGKQGDLIDHRIRLRPFPTAQQKLYGENKKDENILSILYETNGVIFPYTPNIGGISHNVNYTNIDVVHTNQEYYAYRNTEALKFTISGQFSASNYREACYMMACMHFLRSCTKMHYGQSSDLGLPPPVLLLSGYGPYIFNDLPVILTNVTFEYPNNVDMVPVVWQVNGKMKPIAWVPILQNISVSVTVQNTPTRMREFSFDDYVSGKLLTDKPGGMI